MAKKAKKAKANAHRSRPRAQNKKRPATKLILLGGHKHKPNHKGSRPRRRTNPTFFNQSVTPVKMAEYVAGGLIGMGVNKLLLGVIGNAMPSLISNNWMAVLASVGIAFAEWWGFSMIDKGFGSATFFGGLMNSGNQVMANLNLNIPGLSGRGSMGDFVPGKFVVPQNPVLDAATNGMGTHGGMMHRAYPAAYGAAA